MKTAWPTEVPPNFITRSVSLKKGL